MSNISIENGWTMNKLSLKAAHEREGRPKFVFSRENWGGDVEITILDTGVLALREYRCEMARTTELPGWASDICKLAQTLGVVAAALKRLPQDLLDDEKLWSSGGRHIGGYDDDLSAALVLASTLQENLMAAQRQSPMRE